MSYVTFLSHIIYHSTDSDGENMDTWERQALLYLPAGIKTALIVATQYKDGQINELRIRTNRPLCIVIGRKSLITEHICTATEVNEVMQRLCQGSLYSYAENIKEGFIATECGIRAGVCGRAVVIDGRIDCVRDITSINIRIPHRIIGAAKELYELLDGDRSALVYSKPGMGKTTVLRELITLLSAKDNGRKVSVIDTRFELTAGIKDAVLADVFLGYPRKEGMMTAIRTMSPEYIICDEIADAGDAEAIMSANSAGVSVVVSAHADSKDELYKNRHIRDLLDNGVFSLLYGIKDGSSEVTICNDTNNS